MEASSGWLGHYYQLVVVVVVVVVVVLFYCSFLLTEVDIDIE
jgi:hypothetical protein